MKNIGVYLLLAFAAFNSASYAEQAVAEAKVKVEVKSIFKMSLDRADINFRDMLPGQTRENIPETGIKVTSYSNTGRQWFIKLNTVSDLRDGERTIDSKYFQWYGWTEGKGKWTGTGGDVFKQTPALAYISDSSEYVNLPNGVDNYFKFRLTVPQNQVAGFYETIVQFTMTE